MPTGDAWHDFIKDDPILNNGVNNIHDFILLGGGTPINSNNKIIGAIGISGGHYKQDEACCKAALNLWFFMSDQKKLLKDKQLINYLGNVAVKLSSAQSINELSKVLTDIIHTLIEVKYTGHYFWDPLEKKLKLYDSYKIDFFRY